MSISTTSASNSTINIAIDVAVVVVVQATTWFFHYGSISICFFPILPMKRIESLLNIIDRIDFQLIAARSHSIFFTTKTNFYYSRIYLFVYLFIGIWIDVRTKTLSCNEHQSSSSRNIDNNKHKSMINDSL